MAERRRALAEPVELAEPLDLAERPRAGDWSLRAALTRFAQPEPVRVASLLDLVRRMGAAAGDQARTFAADGPQLWEDLQALDGSDRPNDLVGLLAAMAEVDRLGDALTAWATDRSTGAPIDAFDDVVSDVRARLTELGVPEQGPPPAGARGRG